MASASTVAKFLLTLVCENEGDLMSNLKLQKLLYYTQGFHLAVFGEPLFGEPVVAWPYGPVVQEVYEEYRVYRGGAIPCPEGVWDEIEGALTEEQRGLINEVYQEYGQYEASALLRMTHAEPPWKRTRLGSVILPEDMRAYFLTQIER